MESARQELARRELASVWNVDATPLTNPVVEMQRLAGQMRHALDVLGSRLDGDGEPCDVCGRDDHFDMASPPAVAWLRQQRELRQLLEAMERLGLMDKQVRINEQQGQALASVVRAVLDRMLGALVEAVGVERAGELALQTVWAESALVIVPEEFRRLGDVVPGEVVPAGGAA